MITTVYSIGFTCVCVVYVLIVFFFFFFVGVLLYGTSTTQLFGCFYHAFTKQDVQHPVGNTTIIGLS